MLVEYSARRGVVCRKYSLPLVPRLVCIFQLATEAREVLVAGRLFAFGKVAVARNDARQRLLQGRQVRRQLSRLLNLLLLYTQLHILFCGGCC